MSTRYGTTTQQQDYNSIPNQKSSWSNSAYADNSQFRLCVHCKFTTPKRCVPSNLSKESSECKEASCLHTTVDAKMRI